MAIVCLQDAADTSNWALYSLGEAYAHLKWFRKLDQDAPVKYLDAIWGKFHIDNAVLRLYPAAEDMAEFIINFIHINHGDLKDYGKISKASKMGKYLLKNHPKDQITSLLKKLIDDKNWKDVIDYRNKWVHEQPPLCNGMGIRYNRGKRWGNLGRTKFYTIGAGDKSEWEIDELISTVTKAMEALAHALEGFYSMVLSEYQSICKDT